MNKAKYFRVKKQTISDYKLDKEETVYKMEGQAKGALLHKRSCYFV